MYTVFSLQPRGKQTDMPLLAHENGATVHSGRSRGQGAAAWWVTPLWMHRRATATSCCSLQPRGIVTA